MIKNITYKDIVHSITPILDREFNIKVTDVPQEGIFNKKCFYVTLIPTSSQASMRYVNRKSLMVSIKYFGGDKLENYDMADKLEALFSRNLKVNDRFINISNTEANFLNDGVGDMLDFLIYLDYNEYYNIDEKNSSVSIDKMNDIKIKE